MQRSFIVVALTDYVIGFAGGLRLKLSLEVRDSLAIVEVVVEVKLRQLVGYEADSVFIIELVVLQKK